jgi:hypothetical protein
MSVTSRAANSSTPTPPNQGNSTQAQAQNTTNINSVNFSAKTKLKALKSVNSGEIKYEVASAEHATSLAANQALNVSRLTEAAPEKLSTLLASKLKTKPDINEHSLLTLLSNGDDAILHTQKTDVLSNDESNKEKNISTIKKAIDELKITPTVNEYKAIVEVRVDEEVFSSGTIKCIDIEQAKKMGKEGVDWFITAEACAEYMRKQALKNIPEDKKDKTFLNIYTKGKTENVAKTALTEADKKGLKFKYNMSKIQNYASLKTTKQTISKLAPEVKKLLKNDILGIIKHVVIKNNDSWEVKSNITLNSANADLIAYLNEVNKTKDVNEAIEHIDSALINIAKYAVEAQFSFDEIENMLNSIAGMDVEESKKLETQNNLKKFYDILSQAKAKAKAKAKNLHDSAIPASASNNSSGENGEDVTRSVYIPEQV